MQPSRLTLSGARALLLLLKRQEQDYFIFLDNLCHILFINSSVKLMSALKKTATKLSPQHMLVSVAYLENPDFPNGVLPTNKVIIDNMKYLMHPCLAGKLFYTQR